MTINNEKTDVKRYNVTAESGLSTQQLQQRVADGLINKESRLPTKSIGRILCDNFLTLFNLINILLAIAILCVGSYKNVLFMGIVICNAAIGTFQEIRAKRAVEKLSFISSSKVKAIRNSKTEEININDIVLDDVLELSNGNQIPTDCIVLDGECDVNESLLTGESDSIHKKPGDELLSGSFICSGKCRAKAEHIGDDTYVSSVFNKAKYIKKVNSEIMYTLNKIIKIISIAIFPIGILFFISQMNTSGGNVSEAVLSTGAALVGMIPEGLILLTSTVLAVSVIRLSKHRVLVQELYCIETLARVDVLCLDKTGTITQGSMELTDVLPASDEYSSEINTALNALTTSLDDSNPTFNAIKEKYSGKSGLSCVFTVPFSSDKKWSGASFKDVGTYIIGAAEFIFSEVPDDIQSVIDEYSDSHRIIMLAKSNTVITENTLPIDLTPMCALLIKDKIRKNAKKTLKFFEEQGVDLKIISGDNVKTVAGIAKEVGFKNYDKYIDASTLKTEDDIKQAAAKYSIFGRVTPVQKKELLLALKESGHTVAMTGDGVNDVLALKEADCSVAMASGSEAARNVSQLVLLDSDFSSMPQVVAEGRRSINNIQRSASLFLVKTIYCSILSILFVILPFSYPFEPIQMTMLNAFTIGIPSFVLALQPNKNRIEGNFFINVISKSIPTALAVIFSILLAVIGGNLLHLTQIQISTLSVLTTAVIGIMFIIKLCLPFNALRTALVAVCTGGTVLCITLLSSLLGLSPFDFTVLLSFLATAALAVLMFFGFNKLIGKAHLEERIKIKL